MWIAREEEINRQDAKSAKRRREKKESKRTGGEKDTFPFSCLPAFLLFVLFLLLALLAS
jgi:hypothetical protein